MKRLACCLSLCCLILAAHARAATFDFKSALALAQPEAEQTYGKVTFTEAEPYLGADGVVAAWGIEFYAADWKKPVSALALAGQGQAEPSVRLWTGRPCHADADLLAAAALAVHDQLGVSVNLPEKYCWFGERALWAAYPEKTAAGQPVYCNLVDKQAATALPSLAAATATALAPKTAAKIYLSIFGDGDVDYPNDSDIVWLRGQTYRVRWSDFDSSEVEIELYRGGTLKAFRETDNDGSTNWSVAKDFPLGTDYRIKITASHNPFDFDWSDHDFTIASGTRRVIYPSDDGIRWTRGQDVNITWQGFNGSRVRIELWLSGTWREWVTETDNDGLYTWTVDDGLLNSDHYKIRISEENDNSKYDWSDHEFEIRGSSAKVVYPSSSGITWKRGKKYTVKWSGFAGDDVRIELWRDNSLKAWKDADNDGQTSWTVSRSLSKGSDYKIKIYNPARPWESDWSDRSFKISD